LRQFLHLPLQLQRQMKPLHKDCRWAFTSRCNLFWSSL
jgi:hypothetical protein